MATRNMEWAWFAPDTVVDLMGESGRQVSLMSHRAIELMGLDRLFAESPVYESILEEIQEWAVFCWLHREPLEDVKAAIYDGTWRSVRDSFEAWEGMEFLLEGIRAERSRVAALVGEVNFNIRARKTAGSDHGSKAAAAKERRPSDAISPDWFTIKVSAAMRELRIIEVNKLWEVPFWHVMPIVSASVSESYSVWIVPAKQRESAEKKAADFEEMGADFLNSETDSESDG